MAGTQPQTSECAAGLGDAGTQGRIRDGLAWVSLCFRTGYWEGTALWAETLNVMPPWERVLKLLPMEEGAGNGDVCPARAESVSPRWGGRGYWCRQDEE